MKRNEAQTRNKRRTGDSTDTGSLGVRKLVLDGETYRMVPERAFQEMLSQLRRAQAEEVSDSAAVRKAMTSGKFRPWEVVKRELFKADGNRAVRGSVAVKTKDRG